MYKNYPLEEKDEKSQYERERYKNFSEDEKQRLVQYKQKILYNAKK